MPQTVNGDQLRADIDAGRTGDKIPFPDPAAAPLGTDAEADGTATAFPKERRGVAHRPGRNWGGLALYIGATAAIGVIVILIGLATL